MSIASEITRISGNIADAYTSLSAKGATMPASQNSTNLADTIDSIQTGGGGGNAIFAEVDRVINAVDPTLIVYGADGFDISSLVNAGWHCTTYKSAAGSWFNNNRSGAIGYVFSNDVPDTIYVKCDCVYAPSTATVTQITSSPAMNNATVFSITFADDGDRYLIINSTLISSIPYAKISMSQTFNTKNQVYINSFVKYINYTITDTNYSEENPHEVTLLDTYGNLDNTPMVVSDIIEDFTIKNFVFTGTISYASSGSHIPKIFFRKVGAKKFFDYCSDATYGTLQVPASATSSMIGSMNSYYPYFANCHSCGLVFNCSTMSVSTFYIGCMKGPLDSSNKNSSLPYELFMILPNANVKWVFDDSNLPRPISLASLQYMATNAPTVSGKTLTIGDLNIARAGGASGTIITTLTNKGWTVA